MKPAQEIVDLKAIPDICLISRFIGEEYFCFLNLVAGVGSSVTEQEARLP
jgi:hypothetical protein